MDCLKISKLRTNDSALEQEEAFLNLYQGEKEVIVTGEIGGVLWKGKIDC